MRRLILVPKCINFLIRFIKQREIHFSLQDSKRLKGLRLFDFFPNKLEFHLNKCVFKKTIHTMEKTSDAGSQYCCGWVGRGLQPPTKPQSSPLTHKHTQKVSKTLVFPLNHYGLTDGPTDLQNDRPTD